MATKQKLQGERKNAPANDSQVCRPASLRLNREETLSVSDIPLTCKNFEVNQSSGMTRQILRIFVNKHAKKFESSLLQKCSKEQSNLIIKKVFGGEQFLSALSGGVSLLDEDEGKKGANKLRERILRE